MIGMPLDARRRQPVMCILGSVVWAFLVPSAMAHGETSELWEYVDWSFPNSSFAGNAYDVIATATFTHIPSNDQIRTQLFYAGGTTWKLRFTGTRTGEWTFTTESADSDLNGLTGSVTVHPNSNPDAAGFLTTQGNKFALQGGNDGEQKAYRLNVYMNGQDFPAFIHDLTSAETINAYLADAKQYRFDTVFVHLCNNWFHFGSIRWDEHSSENPDRRTFAALENLIMTARDQGMRVQIWAWGDEARRWTPIGAGGINGIPDRRLQRYIAARLGPLPGWTMGYGFDLQEWVNESQIGSWAQFLHAHFGWRRLLWGRGRTHGELDVKSYSGSSAGGQPFSYDDAVSKLNGDLNRPHLYEERFSYLRDGAWTMGNTRRAIWHYTLAGGMGAWWGFYQLGVAGSPLPPYPSPEQLATVNRFWENRFSLDMHRANDLTDGLALGTPSNAHFVFYRENASSIQMDLSGMDGSQPAVALDARIAYAEIDLGTRSTTNQTWTAPYTSDWAIAVGRFSAVPESPLITLSKSEISRVVDFTENLSDDTFTVTNGGIGTLDYAVDDDQPWLSVAPPSGSSTGGADTVTVSYMADLLSIGKHVATVEVNDDGSVPPAGNSPRIITITVDVKTVIPDFDLDGDVDLHDFGIFQACFTAGVAAIPSACRAADMNGDDLVDGQDLGLFRVCTSGADIVADRTCDDASER